MKSWKRFLAALLAVVVAVSGMGISGNAGKGNRVKAQEKTSMVFEGEGFQITYSVEGIWEDGYNGSVIICNTGDKVIENWELSYQTRDEYTSVWNARMSYHADGFYDIKNDKSNADIEPGQEVRYGFKATYQDDVDFPAEFKLLGADSIVPEENVEITTEVKEKWTQGAILDVHIKNVSDEMIEAWKTEFCVQGMVDSVWGGNLVLNEDGVIKVKSCGYNSYIPAGETESFGMQIRFDDETEFAEPTEFTVYEHKKEKWVLGFDKEWNRGSRCVSIQQRRNHWRV